ncbi:General transcription and DNA repair factor IIH subunit TFB5 [Linum perenne]
MYSFLHSTLHSFRSFFCDHLQLIGATKASRRRSDGGSSTTVLINHRIREAVIGMLYFTRFDSCFDFSVEGLVFNSVLKMVNATKGMLISCDIPMAQLIINLNAAQPASQKFIIHVLDTTHLFVQPYAFDMIKNHISEFRDQISYEKPT